ncbi:hypothetical protein BH10ACT11_BH10ACT11_16040 [soil metagenome]
MSRLVVNVDGGSRGNPGQAAVGAVLSTPDGDVVDERGERIGVATNNVAEYKAVLLGVALALEHGVEELEVVGDSELIVKQIQGRYKVKNADLKPLHAEARAALRGVGKWSIRHVRREHNSHADELVNRALDAD